MGIFDIASTRKSMNQAVTKFVNFITALKQPKGRTGRSDAMYEYMIKEIENLKNKEAALKEGEKGLETGYNPARDIGYETVLVDNEGVLTIMERSMRHSIESRIKMGQTINYMEPQLYTLAEEYVWTEYIRERGYNMINYWNQYTGRETKEEKKWNQRYYQMVENMSQGGPFGVFAWSADVELWRKGIITFEQLNARSYLYQDIDKIQKLKEGIIEEYRRSKIIDPSINVPLF